MQTNKQHVKASTGSSLKQALGNEAQGAHRKTNVKPDFIKHCENRRLATNEILNYLRARLPKQYEVAEVVGRWIWLESPAKGGIAATLWLIGFHWNKRRCVWQHPCGEFGSLGSHPQDPRAKYRSYFPADVSPA